MSQKIPSYFNELQPHPASPCDKLATWLSLNATSKQVLSQGLATNYAADGIDLLPLNRTILN
jgi:hypothetical protein